MADAADAPTRLYRAVAEGRSAAEVRAAIQACAASATYAPPVTRRTARSGADVSDAARSLAALVNRVHGRGRGGETALQAAHRLRRGDLVGLLLENGADPANLYSHRRHDPLALCIAYGQAESLRALLRQGGHDANRRLEYRAYQCLDGRYDQYSRCSPVHLCIAPPAVSQGFPPSPPQLACLRVLVEEFGADVDARDCSDETPLHWLAGCQVEPRGTASHPLLLRLIAHGANVDARNRDGYTALMRVVSYGSSNGESAMELLRRSSLETRRATSRSGWSALDSLAFRMSHAPRPWHPPVTAELLRSGCPFQPRHAQELLPVAIPVMQEQELDLEIFRSGRLLWDWRGHEAMVHLALQMQETRFYEEAVAERQAEVRRLEAELRARQSGGGGG